MSHMHLHIKPHTHTTHHVQEGGHFPISNGIHVKDDNINLIFVVMNLRMIMKPLP